MAPKIGLSAFSWDEQAESQMRTDFTTTLTRLLGLAGREYVHGHKSIKYVAFADHEHNNKSLVHQPCYTGHWFPLVGNPHVCAGEGSVYTWYGRSCFVHTSTTTSK